MNPDFRKVALIAASLGLFLSLFVALRPDDEESGTTTTTGPAPVTTLAGVRREIRISVVDGRTTNGTRRETVDVGDEVVFVVSADVRDQIHLHGYDLTAGIGPGKPATIRLTASTPGLFELELEERGLGIAELEVRP